MSEHLRCAQCRNPIRGRQAAVRHERAHLAFHLDCWRDLHQHVQQDYSVQVQADGLAGLLGPYSRARTTDWLPCVEEPVVVEEPLLVDEPLVVDERLVVQQEQTVA